MKSRGFKRVRKTGERVWVSAGVGRVFLVSTGRFCENISYRHGPAFTWVLGSQELATLNKLKIIPNKRELTHTFQQ